MPGACLAYIKIKSLIVLIISVPLHSKQPQALPKHFSRMLVGWLGPGTKKGDKGWKNAEVHNSIFEKIGLNEYPEVKNRTITSHRVHH